MEKIFYANKSDFESSESAVKKIFRDYFEITSPNVLRTANGKPYLENEMDLGLYFSVSHTKEMLFIAVSNQPVGIDAENTNREVAYTAILNKFPDEERKEILSTRDFLLHWVAKESSVKWLGRTLAHDLKKITYIHGKLACENREIPALITVKEFQEHLVCVCCALDFSNAEWIALP